MNSHTEIWQAVALGKHQGLESLSGVQRQVFAITESEVYCDNDSITGLIGRYGVSNVRAFAEAFDAVGATEIAGALRAFPKDEPIPETLLARANAFICERRGYTYESLEALMQLDASAVVDTSGSPVMWVLLPFVWAFVGVVGIWVWISINSYLLTLCPPAMVWYGLASGNQKCRWDLWVFFVRDMFCASFVAFFTVTACAIFAPANKRTVAFTVAGINGFLGVCFISASFKPHMMVGSHRVTVGITFLVALVLAALLVKSRPDVDEVIASTSLTDSP